MSKSIFPRARAELPRETSVEIAARAMCHGGKKQCLCSNGGACWAQEHHGTAAAQAIGALRKAGRLVEGA